MVDIIPYHRPMVKYDGSHMLSNGPKVRLLEEAIKELYDVEYVIACSSCTIGLLIALRALIFPITLPAFTWKSVGDILFSQSINFIDIDARTWNIRENAKGISHINEEGSLLANHTFGNIVECVSNNIIYDGAHALGAKIKDIGLATVFSLAPTKLVTACEGGLILENNNSEVQYHKLLRDRIGRMSEPNAEYGLCTLEHLDEILDWKKKLYDYYKRRLPGIFQEIPHSSNYNTIGMLTTLKIPPHIECRKYYEPLSFEEHLKVTKYVFNKMVCLPSWYGVDYEKITHDILEYNENLNNGRAGVSRTGHCPDPPCQFDP